VPPKPKRKPQKLQTASASPDAAAEQVAKAKLPVTAVSATQGGYAVWLATTGRKDEAESFWGQAKGSYPEIFAQVDGLIESVDIAGSRAKYRLLAGPLPTLAAGEAICRQLRAAQAQAFCIPWSN